MCANHIKNHFRCANTLKSSKKKFYQNRKIFDDFILMEAGGGCVNTPPPSLFEITVLFGDILK